MVTILFVGTYKPILCGIADYTSFLTRLSPTGKWGVISFDPVSYGAPFSADKIPRTERVWHGVPGHYEYSAPVILEGIEQLKAGQEDKVLWFQHETAIWADNRKFVAMLKALDIPKVVTFHTLHFQSDETPSGLRKYQHEMLLDLLPNVEAITVFSRGVHKAVVSAFPEYEDKVHIMRHGIHSYPETQNSGRPEARQKLNEFLVNESELSSATKDTLRSQQIFVRPDVIIIGETGFLCPMKHSESLFYARDELRKLIPQKEIVAVRIGGPREQSHLAYAEELRKVQNGRDKFLLDITLPQNMLPVAQRAFDVNFYWPSECTQSGIIAHALGAGGVIAGRDMEGSGEILKAAGQLADTDLQQLIIKIQNLILNPGQRKKIHADAMRYAMKYSWENQVKKHYELAESLLREEPFEQALQHI
jgi:glycosyltransferase involved in cell wall biosynthesis